MAIRQSVAPRDLYDKLDSRRVVHTRMGHVVTTSEKNHLDFDGGESLNCPTVEVEVATVASYCTSSCATTTTLPSHHPAAAVAASFF